MYVSAYPLALFLATNWWRLRWEPKPVQEDPAWRMRHCLPAIGEGYVWPDLTFASDGEMMLVAVRSTEKSRTSPVRYIADFTGWVPAASFEGVVGRCIEGVLARLEAFGITNSELAGVWAEVRAENDDPAAACLRLSRLWLGMTRMRPLRPLFGISSIRKRKWACLQFRSWRRIAKSGIE